MIASIAQWCSVVAGLWLIGLGIWMMTRPHQALQVLNRMGGTPAIHVGEMSVRIAAGLVLLLAAERALYPTLIAVIGGFLVASAVVILLLPRRWHAAFSTWWAQRIPVRAVRLIAPLSCIMGVALIWVMAPWR